MGNQAGGYSKNPSEPSFYGGIYVKLDQDTFTSGDNLSGNIYLDLVNAYPGDKICIAIKGTEHAKWIDKEARYRQRPDGTQETYYVDVVREQGIDIIKQDLDVYDWQRGAIIPKGQYTFPFRFAVPKGLPGSFFFRGGTTVAEIRYSVEGYLKPERDNVPKLKHKLEVTVRESPNLNIQTKEISINKKLTTWCCFDQGTVSMRTAFEKNAYAPGEEARIICEVDNSKCQLAIPDVSFSLNQNIALNAGGHNRSFGFNIRSISLGRIEPGGNFVGQNRKEASIMLPPGQEGRAKDFNENTPEYSLDPKQFITPSCNGRLVKSSFSLGVGCSIDGCLCCDSAPYNSLPIVVYAPIKPKMADPTPPPNWQPQQMPAANLTIIVSNNAWGGTEIQIQQGGAGAPGMVGNQMPQQQPGFQASPQPGLQQQPQPGFQQQPQPGFQQQPQPGFQQQPQPGYQQPGFEQQQPQPGFQQQQAYGQPQSIQAQPVQIGQYPNQGY